MRPLDPRCVVMVAAVPLAVAPASAQDAVPVTAVPLTDSVWVIEGAVDLIGVVSDPEGTLLVDAGYVETAAGVRAALAEIGVPPPRRIVNTHWHHAFGNEAFDEAEIVAHASLLQRLSRPNVMYGREVPPFPDAALPDLTFSDSLVIGHGGEELRLVHYPNAHTESDVVVFLREGGVVFTGDLFVPHVPWVDVAAGGDARGWLAAVEDLLGRVPDDAVVVPGHGHPSDVRTLRAFRDLLVEAIERVEEGIRAGRTRAEIAAAGLPPRWDDWEDVIPIERFLETVYDSLERGAAPGIPSAGTRSLESAASET